MLLLLDPADPDLFSEALFDLALSSLTLFRLLCVFLAAVPALTDLRDVVLLGGGPLIPELAVSGLTFADLLDFAVEVLEGAFDFVLLAVPFL